MDWNFYKICFHPWRLSLPESWQNLANVTRQWLEEDENSNWSSVSCLCLTVLSVKYCRGWSSARFVTLLWRRAWVRITARLSSHQAWCWRVRQLHLTDSLCTFLVAAKYRATRLRLSYNLEILLQSFWSYICLIARLPLTASGWNSASGRYQEINSRGSL